jgi:hypothetical protein
LRKRLRTLFLFNQSNNNKISFGFFNLSRSTQTISKTIKGIRVAQTCWVNTYQMKMYISVLGEIIRLLVTWEWWAVILHYQITPTRRRRISRSALLWDMVERIDHGNVTNSKLSNKSLRFTYTCPIISCWTKDYWVEPCCWCCWALSAIKHPVSVEAFTIPLWSVYSVY